MTRRLPFETKWPNDPATDQAWFDELERLGPEIIRIKIAQASCGSAGALKGVGTIQMITKGFAEDWFEWRDRKRARKEAVKWGVIFALTAASAVGALVAAWPIAKAWLK